MVVALVGRGSGTSGDAAGVGSGGCRADRAATLGTWCVMDVLEMGTLGTGFVWGGEEFGTCGASVVVAGTGTGELARVGGV